MQDANKFEIHYYFNDDSHTMDAHLRNKCESELLAIVHEMALEFGITLRIDCEAYTEGGFKDKWKLLGDNSNQLTILILLLTIILSRIPTSDNKLKKEETILSIQEKRLNIEKLKKELETGKPNDETILSAADAVDNNLKVVARRSNFYKSVTHCHKIRSVGFSCLDNNNLVTKELVVERPEFHKFILHSNDMQPLVYDDAKVEIISPVLRQGDYKWRGIFNGEPISFSMTDTDFKHDVLLKKISFQNGTVIECVLKVNQKLNEVGDVIPVNYRVETVLEKIDGDVRFQTVQGKRCKFLKKEMASQGNLFPENTGTRSSEPGSSPTKKD